MAITPEHEKKIILKLAQRIKARKLREATEGYGKEESKEEVRKAPEDIRNA